MLNEAVGAGSRAGSSGATPDLGSVEFPPWLRGGQYAACLAADPDTFFPWTYGLQCREQVEAARALCGPCPFREQCLSWAVPRTELLGIWAGTTPPERRRLRAAAAREAA